MKILLVSDEESRYIWDCFDPEVFRGVELILSCGDLKRDYLEFLVTMIPAPLFYVPGNHDKDFLNRPPEGCTNLDGRLLSWRGIRFLGLGGCKSAAARPYEYTEQEMARRLRRLAKPIRQSGGFDILLTHAPAWGLGDGQDAFHQGFACYRTLLEEYHPRYYFFGHQHKGYGRFTGELRYAGATLMNACGYRIIEY